MKLAAGMKLIEEQWIVKPKQFRVKYQQLVDSELVTLYSPEMNTAGLDSDVTTWRYAWKLFKATRTDAAEIQEGELVNICVVDDQDNPITYYVTGEKEVFNKK
ncbi:MAG TPA: hypothetical protein ENK36_02470 [Desulfobacterales bacterium]|nr:hypothetical protein [Desulfobacterales bacterium]